MHHLKLACVAAQGFALLPGDSTLTYLSRPLRKGWAPYTRFNDGACDSKGRFFAGSVWASDRGIPGQLWRYDPTDGTCVVVDEGPFTVSLLLHVHAFSSYQCRFRRVGLERPGMESG